MTTKLFTLVAIVVAAGATVETRAADPTPIQASAQRNVVRNAATITSLAYVRSTSHTDIEYVKGVAYNNGDFDLTYKFTYRDEDRKEQNYTLRFEFNKNGGLKDIAKVGFTGFWPPFGTLELLGIVAKEVEKALDK